MGKRIGQMRYTISEYFDHPDGETRYESFNHLTCEIKERKDFPALLRELEREVKHNTTTQVPVSNVQVEATREVPGDNPV